MHRRRLSCCWISIACSVFILSLVFKVSNMEEALRVQLALSLLPHTVILFSNLGSRRSLLLLPDPNAPDWPRMAPRYTALLPLTSCHPLAVLSPMYWQPITSPGVTRRRSQVKVKAAAPSLLPLATTHIKHLSGFPLRLSSTTLGPEQKSILIAQLFWHSLSEQPSLRYR